MKTKKYVLVVVATVFSVAAILGWQKLQVDKVFRQGVSALVRKNSDLAITCYTEVIRLDPKYAMAYGGRGVVYENKGEHDKAIADYTEAIRLNPKDATAYLGRGVVYGRKSEKIKAEADLAEAKRLGLRGKQGAK